MMEIINNGLSWAQVATLENYPWLDPKKIKDCTKCFGSGELQPDVNCKSCEGTGIGNHNELLPSDESHEILRRQERMYWCSSFLDMQWYRKLFGGKWRLIKLGQDTPYIGLFCTWTKMGDDFWDGYIEIIKTEWYPITGIDSKRKFIKQLLKNIFSLKTK